MLKRRPILLGSLTNRDGDLKFPFTFDGYNPISEVSELYCYLIDKYSLIPTRFHPSSGITIDEEIILKYSNVGGKVLKVSLKDFDKLCLWTEKAINGITVAVIYPPSFTLAQHAWD